VSVLAVAVALLKLIHGEVGPEIRVHSLEHVLARELDPLEVPELRAWLRDLREKIKGASTIRDIYSTMSSLYASATAEGWVRHPSNVVAHPGVKKEIPDLDDSKEVLRLRVEWAQTLIEPPTIPLERRARHSLAFTSGMRDSEIAGVRLKFLQLEAEVPVLKILEAVAIYTKRDLEQLDGRGSHDSARLDGRCWHKAGGDDRRHKRRS
jgi:site-specific recombinase XerD